MAMDFMKNKPTLKNESKCDSIDDAIPLGGLEDIRDFGNSLVWRVQF